MDLQIAFVGTFAGRLEPRVRKYLAVPCDVSGWTEGMLEARVRLIAENVHRVARGEPPVNLVPSSG